MRSSENDSNDPCFEQDMERIQRGYRMLDNIEHKLKNYLDTGDSRGTEDLAKHRTE
jgi:hypothetical protein